MLENARKANTSNVSFVRASATLIPLSFTTTNCIIINCIINLVLETNKVLVFREAFRLLKLGGRVAVSDILAKKEQPAKTKENIIYYYVLATELVQA